MPHADIQSRHLCGRTFKLVSFLCGTPYQWQKWKQLFFYHIKLKTRRTCSTADSNTYILLSDLLWKFNSVQMWTYSSVEIPGSRVSRTDRIKIYLSECVVCFCIVFFIICVGLLLYLFFHLYSTVSTAGKLAGNLAESWNMANPKANII